MKLLKNVYDKLDINVSDIDIKIPSTSGLNYSMIQIKKIKTMFEDAPKEIVNISGLLIVIV